MIPAVIAPPVPSERAAVPGRVARTTGWSLIAAVVLGSVVWTLLLSPYGFRRVDPMGEGSALTFRQPGTYVVFLEYPGATDDAAKALTVAVRSPAGRRVVVRPLVNEATGKSQSTYRIPGREGRSLGSFNVVDGGSYQVSVFPSANADGDIDFGRVGHAQVAIGNESSLTWAATPWGLLPLAVFPLAAGVALLMVARHQRREEAPAATL